MTSENTWKARVLTLTALRFRKSEMPKHVRLSGESRDHYLARTKYAGRESASERAARKEAERHITAPPVPKDQTIEEWYGEYRKTPKSRGRRKKHKRNIPSDAQSGGGEAFADRSTSFWFWGRKQR